MPGFGVNAGHIARKPEVSVARAYSDYTVTVDTQLPAGVSCERLS